MTKNKYTYSISYYVVKGQEVMDHIVIEAKSKKAVCKKLLKYALKEVKYESV